jgi:hypothetical protein
MSLSVTPRLEMQQFPEHYAYALVESGETKTILYIRMTGGFVGFIERIACNWTEGSAPPATRTIHKLIIDGFTREIDYEIQINKPYTYDPPIVVREYIRWITTNNDVPYTSEGTAKTGAHFYGIMIDGVIARPKSDCP